MWLQLLLPLLLLLTPALWEGTETGRVWETGEQVWRQADRVAAVEAAAAAERGGRRRGWREQRQQQQQQQQPQRGQRVLCLVRGPPVAEQWEAWS